jgi:aminomethyltransferase
MDDGTAKTTALTAVHEGLGARMVPFAGYSMPLQYDGILKEHTRVREAVGLFDVSHMGEVWFRGPGALDVLNGLITNDLHRIADGRAQYTAMCAPDGTIVDDLIVYRFSAEELLVCVNASNRHTDVAHMRAHVGAGAEITDESDLWSQIAVQGPRAQALLTRLFGEEIGGLKPFRVRRIDFHGHGLIFSTTGYTGERGGEIYLPNEAAPEVWEALMESGGDLGVGPAGLGARDTLRLEMAYCLYGNDIDRTTTPLEAGLGWVTRLAKDDFVGREALVAQKDAGVPRRLVGLEILEKGIPRQGYDVLHGGEVVGGVTSGTRSPSTGRNIGLAYVPAAVAAVGTELAVDCRGKERPARVVETPFLSKT